MTPRVAVFLLVCAAQLAWTGATIWSAEARREAGRVWRFRTAPVDPADLVRGRYVRLDFEATSGPAHGPGPFEPGQTAYALLEEGEEGFAQVSGVTRAAPDTPDGDAHLEVRVRSAHAGRVFFEFPVDRLYLPEEKAPVAERLTRQLAGRTWAEIRVHEGHATLLDVFLDGVPLSQAVEAPMREADPPRRALSGR